MNQNTAQGIFEHYLKQLPFKSVLGIAIIIRDLRNKKLGEKGIAEAVMESDPWTKCHPVGRLGLDHLAGIIGMIVSLFGDFFTVEEAYQFFQIRGVVV